MNSDRYELRPVRSQTLHELRPVRTQDGTNSVWYEFRSVWTQLISNHVWKPFRAWWTYNSAWHQFGWTLCSRCNANRKYIPILLIRILKENYIAICTQLLQLVKEINDKGFFVSMEIFQEPAEINCEKCNSTAILVWRCWERVMNFSTSIIYTITWLLCAFSLVVDRHLLNDTHTDGVKSTSDHVSRLVFLFPCPKSPSINRLNFYCIKQIDNIFPCVCTVIDHRRRHSV